MSPNSMISNGEGQMIINMHPGYLGISQNTDERGQAIDVASRVKKYKYS